MRNSGGTPFVDYTYFKQLTQTNGVYYGMLKEYERNAAFYGTATYTYNNRYTITGTARADGSNRMGNTSARAGSPHGPPPAYGTSTRKNSWSRCILPSATSC
ncbi:hypothetical protein ACQ86N_31110 [Puia sp. P3]|uniref:hypothetical protein n=1 Tax=Puia sp. P3 TaxID=3423952 RepID=UPI003D666B98